MNSPRPHLLLLPFAVLLADMAALAQVTGEERWPDVRLVLVVSLALSQAPLVAIWASFQHGLTTAARWALASGVVVLWSWQLRQKAPQLTPVLTDWLLILGGAALAAAMGAWWWGPHRNGAGVHDQKTRRRQFSLATLLLLLTLAALTAATLRRAAIPEDAWGRAGVLVAAAGVLAALAWRVAPPVPRLLRAAIPLTAAALTAGQAMVWTESFAAGPWRLAMGLVAAQSAALVVAGKTLAAVNPSEASNADASAGATGSTNPPPAGSDPRAAP
jgi:hypothetical protein